MKRQCWRTLWYYTLMGLIIAIVLESIGYMGLWIKSRNDDFLGNKNYFNIRSMLMGKNENHALPRYLSLPYLGYIPYPGYTKNGIVQHNQDGYRGNKVPVAKTDKYRVLCLGGSTTYGFGVDTPFQTYPAQLETMLSEKIKHDTILSKRYAGVEVLNAGVEAATSAELLQQYLFKYRYYKPDAVVLHSGINDAIIASESSPDFQLDYTHYRRIDFYLKPLAKPMRWLMHSYFVSFCSIALFYNDFANNSFSFRKDNEQLFCKWSKVKSDSTSLQYNPFYNNSNTLLSAILADSANVYILPELLNPYSTYVQTHEKYSSLSRQYTHILNELAVSYKHNCTFIPFDSIKDNTWWIDDCHLNREGEQYKAQVVSEYMFK